MKPKNPVRPPRPLDRHDSHLFSYQGPIFRIASAGGAYPTAWNEFRAFGPIAVMRWDPHHPPPSSQPDRAVFYGSPEVVTAVAERFQKYRHVNLRTATPYLTGFIFIRPLRLLDLTGGWPLSQGASDSLGAAPKSTCRNWAAQILDTWPDLDGLRARSTMTGRQTFALFPAASTALPRRPMFQTLLTHPDIYRTIAAAADQVGYSRDAL